MHVGFFSFSQKALGVRAEHTLDILSSAISINLFHEDFLVSSVSARDQSNQNVAGPCVPAASAHIRGHGHSRAPGTMRHGCVLPAVDGKAVPYQTDRCGETASRSRSACKAAAIITSR